TTSRRGFDAPPMTRHASSSSAFQRIASTTWTSTSASSGAWRAVRLRRRLIARLASRCRPGVSMNTTCASLRLRIPRMRWRVVCGFGVTMLSGIAIAAFSRVDLPTFGRPIRATWPNRCGASSTTGGLVVELPQRLLRRVLFGCAPAAAATAGAQFEALDGTGDFEGTCVVATVAAGKFVHRQRERARLDQFLQAGLGILGHAHADFGHALREQASHDIAARIPTRIEVDRANQRLERVGKYRLASVPAALHLAGAQMQAFAEFLRACDLGERRAVDQGSAQARHLPLVR